MTFRYSTSLLFALLLLAGRAAQAQQQPWCTSEVAVELGLMPCDHCVLGRGHEQPVTIGNSRITPVTMFYFDTIATHARGRVVDSRTGKPIKGAFIQTAYTCWAGCDTRAAFTNETGFFVLGWVGCHGLNGPRSNRPLLIQATGYEPISTEAVAFGGGAYLHVELAAKAGKKP